MNGKEGFKKALELQLDFFNAAEELTWAYIGKGDHVVAAASFQNFAARRTPARLILMGCPARIPGTRPRRCA